MALKKNRYFRWFLVEEKYKLLYTYTNFKTEKESKSYLTNVLKKNEGWYSIRLQFPLRNKDVMKYDLITAEDLKK